MSSPPPTSTFLPFCLNTHLIHVLAKSILNTLLYRPTLRTFITVQSIPREKNHYGRLWWRKFLSYNGSIESTIPHRLLTYSVVTVPMCRPNEVHLLYTFSHVILSKIDCSVLLLYTFSSRLFVDYFLYTFLLSRWHNFKSIFTCASNFINIYVFDIVCPR